MSESEEPIPWPEARPPHLPDRLTAIPVWIWPFVVVAALGLFFAWRDLAAASLDAADVIPYAIGYLPTILTSMLGAALFWRHPGAWRTLPWVAIGVTLLAIGELLQLFSSGLQRAFVDLTPPSGDLMIFVPASIAYGLVAKLVEIVGVLALARGLRDARRRDDVGSSRPLLLALLAVIVIGLIGTVVVWPTYEGASAADIASAAISVAAAIAYEVAWVVLTVVAVAGWRAGEAPRSGWLAAALGGLVLVVGLVLSTAISLAVAVGIITAETYPMDLAIVTFSILGIVPLALWFAAFALGLPSTRASDDA